MNAETRKLFNLSQRDVGGEAVIELEEYMSFVYTVSDITGFKTGQLSYFEQDNLEILQMVKRGRTLYAPGPFSR